MEYKHQFDFCVTLSCYCDRSAQYAKHRARFFIYIFTLCYIEAFSSFLLTRPPVRAAVLIQPFPGSKKAHKRRDNIFFFFRIIIICEKTQNNNDDDDDDDHDDNDDHDDKAEIENLHQTYHFKTYISHAYRMGRGCSSAGIAFAFQSRDYSFKS